MDKEIIDKVMFDNFLRSVPTMVVDTKDRKTISAYGSIDADNLRSAIDIFKKAPDYGELLKQVKKQKEVIDRTINAIDLVIELIKQQPTEDDKWILDRLNGFKIILEDKEVSDE